MEIRLGYIEQYETGYSTFLDKELTEQEYEHYLTHIDELNIYENLKRLFQIFILNNNEFIEFAESESKLLFENSLSITGNKENYNQHYLNLNRIFLNYLTSFRTLLDHIETIIKRKYGKESVQATKLKNLTSHLYDTYFAYRFIYKLRNYAQHCGLPIDEFSISAKKMSDNKYKSEYKIDFDCNTLQSKFKEWGTVKNDFLKHKTISIFSVLDEMKIAIDQLWNETMIIFESDIESAINFIIENAGHLKTKHCEVCLFTDIKTDENNVLKYFTNQTIPFDIIDELKKNKNCT
jgi:hypothetical protein